MEQEREHLQQSDMERNMMRRDEYLHSDEDDDDQDMDRSQDMDDEMDNYQS